MEFLAQVARDGGVYGEDFSAQDWAAAEAHCEANGWLLLGVYVDEVPAHQTTPQQMDELLARRNAGQLDG